MFAGLGMSELQTEGRHELKTTLVNLRTYKERDVVLIDRRTTFGNPFKIGKDGDRQEVVDKYRDYFNKRLKTDEQFCQSVCSLKGCILGCWCTPLLCHGDIIVEWLDDCN